VVGTDRDNEGMVGHLIDFHQGRRDSEDATRFLHGFSPNNVGFFFESALHFSFR
jgi:hypothetical protein